MVLQGPSLLRPPFIRAIVARRPAHLGAAQSGRSLLVRRTERSAQAASHRGQKRRGRPQGPPNRHHGGRQGIIIRRGKIGMKLLCTAAVLCTAATVSFAAGLPARGLSGNYLAPRTADDYTGPCFANGEVEINGKEAVFGWKINNGAWEGVSLAGLGVVCVVRTQHTLGDIHRPINPAIAVLIVDSRATADQPSALLAFAKAQAPDLLTNVVEVKSAPIELIVANANIHGAAARLTPGSLAEIATRCMTAADHPCRNTCIYYPPLAQLNHGTPA